MTVETTRAQIESQSGGREVSEAGPTLLERKIRGCLYGGAIGDALGAPAEGRDPDEIAARYGAITDFVEPWDGPSEIGKGDGRYTDDSHMIQLLSRIYLETNDHLDVFTFAKKIVPLIADEPRWVPEYGREMLLVDRLFYPEKWLLIRLRLANCDPRIGGIGNMVNCGAAMYASPIGIVNAGDPAGAYREAIEVLAAHQTSYGLEAAGVIAACIAEALKPDATLESIVDTARESAKEGTRLGIDAAVDRARTLTDWRSAIAPLRDAIRPFDGAAERFADRGNGSDDWNPSRVHSIEELPIALGFLVVTGGDFEQSMFGAANYGRDNDSIASMAGAIAGALRGDAVIRSGWIERIKEANRINLDPIARDLSSLAIRLQRRQLEAAQDRAAMFDKLEGSLVV
jgi:ADP-ribosylglycohydrolase